MTSIKNCDEILKKYPERRAVVVDKSDFKLDKNKFLVPLEMSVAEFMVVLRKRINLKPEEAIFLFCNGKLLVMSQTFDVLYKNEVDPKDGFIHFVVKTESTFGN